MATTTALDEAFGKFTAEVVEKVQRVNAACSKMRKAFPEAEFNFDPHDTKMQGNGVLIREYENAMEDLKRFIENRDSSDRHNVNLKRVVDTGQAPNRHAIRGLEVELVHPEKDEPGYPEWWIKGVRVRGLISIDPADGNETPNYSSKSSSSSASSSST
jgi:hypothetical protein